MWRWMIFWRTYHGHCHMQPYEINIFRSSWIRYELLNMRMNRYIIAIFQIINMTLGLIKFVPNRLKISIIFSWYIFSRYFRKSKRISKIETFIRQSKLGDWSVDVNMFLSREGGGEGNCETFSESTRLIIQSWAVKVSNQFQGNCKQSYF